MNHQVQPPVHIMFGQTAHASSAYGRIAVESAARGASQHQLIGMLFAGVMTYIARARTALTQGDVTAKVQASSLAIRLIDEGLKTAVDRTAGEIGESLYQLYDYCTRRLLHAHLRNDDAAYAEVARLLSQIADAWRTIATDAKPAPMQRAA